MREDAVRSPLRKKGLANPAKRTYKESSMPEGAFTITSGAKKMCKDSSGNAGTHFPGRILSQVPDSLQCQYKVHGSEV